MSCREIGNWIRTTRSVERCDTNMDVARWEELGPQAARPCSLNDKFPSIYKQREMGFLEDEEKSSG